MLRRLSQPIFTRFSDVQSRNVELPIVSTPSGSVTVSINDSFSKAELGMVVSLVITTSRSVSGTVSKI